jgi:polyisoprenoid-binding protein YceI
MKRITLFIPAAAISTPVFAVPETYVIDVTHTYPRFSYSHFGFSTQLSRFVKTSGNLVIDHEAKTGAVNVTIATASVDTGYPLFNEHIHGKDFLETAKYPTATFTSSKINFDGDKLASVEGTLTLKGISKPVTLDVTSFYIGRDFLPVYATPDAEKGRLRRQCNCRGQAYRFQHGQICP